MLGQFMDAIDNRHLYLISILKWPIPKLGEKYALHQKGFHGVHGQTHSLPRV